MKKLLITLIAVLVLAGIAVITCPDKQAHKEAIMAVINEKIDETVSGNASEGDEGLAVLASSLGSGLVGYFMDNRLTVKNHFVYSTGTVNGFNGESRRVSVGVFGHVFTFSKEDFDEATKGVF